MRTLFYLVVTCLAIALCPALLCSQEWNFVKSIAVGKYAERAVTAAGGDEIYVANRGSCSLSVISTLTNKSVKTIELGKTPKALVASHDGHLYVLAQDVVREPCELPANEDGNYSVGIVNAGSNAVESWVSIPGQRWDDAALAGDGRLFLTRVIDDAGVYVFDTTKREFQQTPVIPGREGCPVDLALAEQQNELFVAYQCGGWPGHDPIGIYCLTAKNTCRSAYDEIAVVSGFPNVGGVMSVSPDESYLWAYGDDACSQPAYDHKGCPGTDRAKGIDAPTRILNLIDTDSLVVRTYPFPLGNDGRFVSFSPELEAYIGGQTGISVVRKPGVGLPEKIEAAIPNDDACHNLSGMGQINFRRMAGSEFMYAVASNDDAVCIFERPAPHEIAQSRHSTEPAQPGKMYAIVVGIKSFMYGWDPLEYPVSDAAKVATALTRYYGFNVTTLPAKSDCGGSACYVTKKQIIDAFQNVLYESPGKKRDFTPQDQLLVYISSHGDRWPGTELASHHFLVTSDSMVKDSPMQTAATELDYQDIWNLLEASNIRHVLFVVDTCYAGLYTPDAFGGPTFQVPLQNGKPFFRTRSLTEALERNVGITRKYLSASPFVNEQVPDHSAFAQQFVDALDSMRTSTAGYFTFESLLTKMVNLDPQPRPSSYSLDDSPHGDFVFIPNTTEAAR
jgi:YVTN family beta-propeller protein